MSTSLFLPVLSFTLAMRDEEGKVWAFRCEECDYDLHPKCALEDKKINEEGVEGNVKMEENPKEGWVCDGDVCYKAS